jgi:DNA-binding transcriptional MerR regulator
MSAQPARGYFGISEVLAQLRADFPDISVSKIRFLETEGLIAPVRSPAGYRRFCRQDVDRLRFVLAAQRDQYLPLRVIRERLARMDQQGAPPETAARPGQSGPGDLDRSARPGWSDGREAAAGGRDTAPGSREAVGSREAAAGGWEAAAGGREAAAPGEAWSAGSRSGEARSVERRRAEDLSGADRSREVWSGAARSGGDRSGGSGGWAPGRAADGRDGRSQGGPAPSGLHAEAGQRDEPAAPELLTRRELVETAGLTEALLTELETFGLLRRVGRHYGRDAVEVAKAAVALTSFGVEARHLRAVRAAAERETTMIESLVAPILRQRGSGARELAGRTARDCAVLVLRLHGALVDGALAEAGLAEAWLPEAGRSEAGLSGSGRQHPAAAQPGREHARGVEGASA